MKIIKNNKPYNTSKILLISLILIIIFSIILQININIQNRKQKNNLINNSLYFVKKAQKILQSTLEHNKIEIDTKKEYIVINIETDKLNGYLAVLIHRDIKNNQSTYEYHIMTTNDNFKICGTKSNKLNIDSIEEGNCCKNPKEELEIEGRKYTVGYQMTLKD